MRGHKTGNGERRFQLDHAAHGGATVLNPPKPGQRCRMDHVSKAEAGIRLD
jgi:hypothetical protein